MSPLTILAPTDPQLAFIRKLCAEQGWQFPDAIASMAEAGRIIDEMKASTYRPEDYAYPFADYSEEVPF
jgi:hypothetical protein